jgi:predicted regulator of Ras-like GTPase activity (Roadblock/LC7/MglB family)
LPQASLSQSNPLSNDYGEQIMVKKTTKQETAAAVFVDENELLASSEDQTFTDLNSKLAEIRKAKDVIGYIIRNTTSATIDLKEPEKLVEYAIFSSQVMDSTREISGLLEIGDVKCIFVEGKETNALCMALDGNKISIFMEKNADLSRILKRLSP